MLNLTDYLKQIKLSKIKTDKEWVRFLIIHLWKDKINRLFFILSLLFLFVSFMLVLLMGINLREAVETVAIRYNIYFGVDLVGRWYKLFVYPIIALAIFLINFILSSAVFRKEKLLSYYLSGATATLLALNLTTLIFVLMLNFEFLEK